MSTNRETVVVFVRHGLTEWNSTGRIQGHTDVPLSAVGREEVVNWKLPERFQYLHWVSSPLKRALETAALMGGNNPIIEPRLMEMSWGKWEGLTLSQLRERFGTDMGENEARGLDFTPDGGESPRQVRQRVADWLSTIAVEGQSCIVITHKGVIRSAISLATQWDMTKELPFPMHRDCAQVFQVNERCGAVLYATNVPLTARGKNADQ